MFGTESQYCFKFFDPRTWRTVFFSQLICFNRAKTPLGSNKAKEEILCSPGELFNPFEYFYKEPINIPNYITRHPQVRKAWNHSHEFKLSERDAIYKEQRLRFNKLEDCLHFNINGVALNEDEFKQIVQLAKYKHAKSNHAGE